MNKQELKHLIVIKLKNYIQAFENNQYMCTKIYPSRTASFPVNQYSLDEKINMNVIN